MSDGDAATAATGRRRHRTDRRQRPFWVELPVLLVIALVLALLVRTFLAQAFFIPSGSMEPTLHGCTGCTGDRILVTKPPYWFGDPEPGDIVVFTGPDTWTPEVPVTEPSNWFTGALLELGRSVGVAPPSADDYVKRVIAVGGQTVQCCDAQGRVTVDGQPLDESYVPAPEREDQLAFGPVTVPEGRLWVMGDHRDASADSRVHLQDRYQGTIAVDDVIGKASLVIYPFSRARVLHSVDPQPDASGPVDPTAPLLAGAALLTWRRRASGG